MRKCDSGELVIDPSLHFPIPVVVLVLQPSVQGMKGASLLGSISAPCGR